MKNRIGRGWAVSLILLAAVCGCANEPAKDTVAKAAEPGMGKAVTIDFEQYEVGKLPADFEMGLTGGGGAVEWVIHEDPDAPAGRKVLEQTSKDDTDNRFPLCVYKSLEAKDVEVSVKFKPVAGKVDQAGGLVVRYRDKDNYYITRANALEDNVRLYKVIAGDRKQFASVNHKVASGQWHTLKLRAQGNHFVVSFDGEKLFEADDDTFKDSGKVGLWTKADSVSEFDDLRIESLDRR